MKNLAYLALIAALALASCSKSNQQSSESKPEAAPPATSEVSETAAAPTSAEAPATDPTIEPDAVAPAPMPSFTDPKLKSGYLVFQKWCAPCHAPGPLHPGTQALAVKYKGTDTPAELENRTDLTPDVVKTFVRGGVSIMPPFRKTEITDSELDDLAAYLSRPH